MKDYLQLKLHNPGCSTSFSKGKGSFCYKVLNVLGNYTSAVEECSKNYVWYTFAFADLFTIDSNDSYDQVYDLLYLFQFEGKIEGLKIFRQIFYAIGNS